MPTRQLVHSLVGLRKAMSTGLALLHAFSVHAFWILVMSPEIILKLLNLKKLFEEDIRRTRNGIAMLLIYG